MKEKHVHLGQEGMRYFLEHAGHVCCVVLKSFSYQRMRCKVLSTFTASPNVTITSSLSLSNHKVPVVFGPDKLIRPLIRYTNPQVVVIRYI